MRVVDIIRILIVCQILEGVNILPLFSEKSGRPDTIKEEEKRSRRKSIEYEDPSIVAFGKAVDSKESGKYGKGSEGKSDIRGKDEDGTAKQRGADAEKSRGKDNNADDDRKTKNKVGSY